MILTMPVAWKTEAAGFEAAGNDGDLPFGAVLDTFYDGERDPETLRLLG